MKIKITKDRFTACYVSPVRVVATTRAWREGYRSSFPCLGLFTMAGTIQITRKEAAKQLRLMRQDVKA